MRQHLAHKAVKARIREVAVKFEAKKMLASIGSLQHQSFLRYSINQFGALTPSPAIIDPKPKKLFNDPDLVKLIVRTISKYENVSTVDLFAHRRHNNVSLARHICMHLIYAHTEWSFPRIGDYFNGRDHTVPLYAKVKILKLSHTSKEFCQRLAGYESFIAHCKEYGLDVNNPTYPLTAGESISKSNSA